MKDICYIYMDWGTTNCRIYTLDADYQLLEEFDHPSSGILSIKTQENYRVFYEKNILPHRKNDSICVYMSGMVGSAPYGWATAPQLSVPLNVATLAQHLHEISGFKNIFIIPGIKESNETETYDLIRGEEIQAFGIGEMITDPHTAICLPGTHSKWLFFQGEEILKFRTMMTGETFNIFKQYSILGSLIDKSTPQDFNEKYFLKGLEESKNNDNLLNSLFKVRAIFVGKENVESSQVQAYLSGILIGYEVAKAITSMTDVENSTVIIVSSSTLATPYQQALNYHNIKNKWIDAKTASINGLKHILSSLPQHN